MQGASTVNSTALVTVPFHGDGIVSFEANGEPHVAMRRIVENLGLSWGSQQRKLEATGEKFACTHMSTHDATGRIQQMLAMPVRKLPLWLATINPNKVREDIRPKVILYQEECAVALHDYWTKGTAIRGDLDGVVTSLDPAVVKVLGGVFKSVLAKSLHEVLPAMVEAEIASQQYGVVRGLTAGDVLTLAGIENRKGLRGIPRRVSDRLRLFHAEKGRAVNIARLGPRSAYIFDPATAREWLDGGGKASIQGWIAERRGQGVLKLVPQ